MRYAGTKKNDNTRISLRSSGLRSLYENGATLSVQPHPEFTAAFAHICCEARQGNAPGTLVATAKASLEQPLDSADLGRAITRFLAKPRKS